jgi:hypothetical protein
MNIERFEVTPGNGTVIRFGAVVAWADPAASPALLSFLTQSAHNLAPSARGGRQVADHIAAVLANRDPEPAVGFAVIGPSDHGWATLLHGPVQAWDGGRWLYPPPNPGWIQAIITPRPAITVGIKGSATPALDPNSLYNLEVGVVPGAGFVLLPGVGSARSAPPGVAGGSVAGPDDVAGDGDPTVMSVEATPGPMLISPEPGSRHVAATTALPETPPTEAAADVTTTTTTPTAAAAEDEDEDEDEFAVLAPVDPTVPARAAVAEPADATAGADVIDAAVAAPVDPTVPAKPAVAQPAGATAASDATTDATATSDATATDATTTTDATATDVTAATDATTTTDAAATDATTTSDATATDVTTTTRAGAGTDAAPEAPAKPGASDQTADAQPSAPPQARAGGRATRPGPTGRIDLRQPALTERRPLPPVASADPTIPGAPVVAGVACPAGHFNRPGLDTCVRCGASISRSEAEPVSGTRPALGTLIGDDGTIYRLDQGYLIGSDAQRDPTVGGGLARPLTLTGDGISTSHAEVRLQDWDVTIVDRGSAGGTSILEPGMQNWTPLNPYEPRAIPPGTHVAFGPRVVTFLGPWARRR